MRHSLYIHPGELQRKRLMAGVTQQQVANQLEVHRSTVVRWEHSFDVPVKREHIEALGALLGIEVTARSQPFTPGSPLPSEQPPEAEMIRSVEDAWPDADARDTLIAVLFELAGNQAIDTASLNNMEGAMLMWLIFKKLKLAVVRLPEK